MNFKIKYSNIKNNIKMDYDYESYIELYKQKHNEQQIIYFIKRNRALHTFKKYDSTEFFVPYETVGKVYNANYEYNLLTIDTDKLIQSINNHLVHYKSFYDDLYLEELYLIKDSDNEEHRIESIKNLLMNVKTCCHEQYINENKIYKQLRLHNIHNSTNYITNIYLIDLLIDCCKLFIYYGLIKHKQDNFYQPSNEPYDVISACKTYKTMIHEKYMVNCKREKERKNVSLLSKTKLPNDICKYIIQEFL